MFFMLLRYLNSITCKTVFSRPPTRVPTVQFQLYSSPCQNELKGAAPRFFDECQFVVTIIIHVIKLLIDYIHQSTKTNIAQQRYIRSVKTLCVNNDSSHLLTIQWRFKLSWGGSCKTRIGK
jgi:hypothetical protein